MMRFCLGIAVIILLAFFGAEKVRAQGSCYVLKAELQELIRSKVQIMRDYPFTVSIIRSCLKQPDDNQAGCIITACTLQAIFIGQQQCITFVSQLGAIEERISEVSRQLKNC